MYNLSFMQLLEYCNYDYMKSICITFIGLLICIIIMIVEKYTKEKEK